ncbi:MAG: ribosome biogenesis GTP-binding protein YihA/YsxC [Clostridia bacterium]
MKINEARHEATAVRPQQYPEGNLPEAAFAGRSNVGKSSIINAIVNRKRLAYVGATPGKTRQINFYNVNDEFRLVDLPGYGYAKVSKAEKKSWGSLADTYLENREQLKLIILMIDIRHKPSAQDKDMAHWLTQSGIPYAVCAVKSDKITRGSYRSHAIEIIRELELARETPFAICSATKKQGIEELRNIIENYLFDK